MAGIARGLAIHLGRALVGHMVNYSTGANVFYFAEGYIELRTHRPVLGYRFAGVGDPDILHRPYAARQKLPPFFSNLLPEGALREYIAKAIKTHPENEFDLLAHLGENLPGAVTALPVEELPAELLNDHEGRAFEPRPPSPLPFSLGGAQLKFSMFQHGSRFSMSGGGGAEYIVKPPHPNFPGVPTNEYIAMRLAEAAGLDVPEVLLVPLSALEPEELDRFGFRMDEGYAYAIRRFDRSIEGRVHAEDFAQVLNVYPSDEYRATNYDTVLRILSHLPEGRRDVQEMVGRLVVNALLANGDAHLKNMGLIYPDGRTPRLGPLYDVVSTSPYIKGEESAALNLRGTKRFQDYDRALFEAMAQQADIDRSIVLEAVDRTMERAADTWPRLFDELEPPEFLRKSLAKHWRSLRPAFAAVSSRVLGKADKER